MELTSGALVRNLDLDGAGISVPRAFLGQATVEYLLQQRADWEGNAERTARGRSLDFASHWTSLQRDTGSSRASGSGLISDASRCLMSMGWKDKDRTVERDLEVLHPDFGDV